MSNVIGNNFQEMKQKLDSVGCGFCLAKWTQVTMHLHDGTTHSCHHPAPHKIGLREIQKDHPVYGMANQFGSGRSYSGTFGEKDKHP